MLIKKQKAFQIYSRHIEFNTEFEVIWKER